MDQNSSSSMSKEFEIKVLKDEIDDLRKEIESYKKTLASYDIDEIEEMTDVEYICIEEIKKLKRLSDTRGLDDVEVKNLDLLHKNLRMIRNQPVEKKTLKAKVSSVEDLLKIVEGGKDN